MALQGNLSDLPLIDLVQVLALQNKTGVLSLSRHFSQAQVCFNKSCIFSTYIHDSNQQTTIQGADAIFELLNWSEGQFSFEITASLPATQNVWANWDYLVLEKCRRDDELTQNNPLAEVCPHLSLEVPAQAEINLSLEEWQVLLKIDGHTSFQTIASSIRQSLEVVLNISQQLQSRLLVEIEQVPVFSAQVVYYEQPTTPRWKMANALRQPQLALAGAVTYPTNRNAEKPKVQRGVLSNLMAKIRGL